MYKNKYLKYKSKYLNIKQNLNQIGGEPTIMEFTDSIPALKELSDFIINAYNENSFTESTHTWLMFTMGRKTDRKLLAEYSLGIGSAGISTSFSDAFGVMENTIRSHKFRPLIEVTNDKDNNAKILRILLESLIESYLKSPGKIIAGKIWIKNIEECQCGKFFDFYANYTKQTFYLFKRSIIEMCKRLIANNVAIEKRCNILLPSFYTESSEEDFSNQSFSTDSKRNYKSCKLEYQYFKSDKVIITYRNDIYGRIPLKIIKGIINRIKEQFIDKGILDINKFNSALCEKNVYDELIKDESGELEEEKKQIDSAEWELQLSKLEPLVDYDSKYKNCPVCKSNFIDDDFGNCNNCQYVFEDSILKILKILNS
jgi:hypothetical protein